MDFWRDIRRSGRLLHMRKNFATCFDSAYLLKGVVMIESLIRESADRHNIHVLAMDEECERVLRALNLRGVQVYAMKDFEVLSGMAKVRETRSWKEYAWTCGSVFTDFVAPLCSGQVCYLDADLFWFFDPGIIFHEIDDRAIGITPHRFAKKDEPRLLPNGKFNVQICAFQGPVGIKALHKWAKQCKEWCYDAHVDGKFGDQGYLDSWPTDYPGEVCEISNPGVGLAPWNIANWSVSMSGEHVFVDTYRLVAYHMHEFLDYGDGRFRLTNWRLRETDKELIYKPYIDAIQDVKLRIQGVPA
jgi:hypothetical protein